MGEVEGGGEMGLGVWLVLGEVGELGYCVQFLCG